MSHFVSIDIMSGTVTVLSQKCHIHNNNLPTVIEYTENILMCVMHVANKHFKQILSKWPQMTII